MKRGRFLSLALKDDRVEQCLRSCGVNPNVGPKQKKHESHDSCVCIAGFSACGCQKKSAVYETGWRHVAVQKGKQGPEPSHPESFSTTSEQNRCLRHYHSFDRIVT